MTISLLLAGCARIDAKPGECTPGERVCEGTEILRCRGDGLAYELFTSCGDGETCANGACVDADQDVIGGDTSTTDTVTPDVIVEDTDASEDTAPAVDTSSPDDTTTSDTDGGCQEGTLCGPGTEACTELRCVKGSCVLVQQAAGTLCEDDDSCSFGERCDQEGQCSGGVDVCGSQLCAFNSDCDNGDRCDGTEFCDTAMEPPTCRSDPTSAVTCDPAAAPPCKTMACDPANGDCVAVPLADGSVCDDGSACTIGDSCVGGACTAGVARGCFDDNPCTEDSCDPATGCVHTDTTTPCEDGNACTVGDVCGGGACQPGENTCSCSGTPDCAALEDGDRCNGTLVCDGQLCVIDPQTVIDCPEPAPCHVAACDPENGACGSTPVANGTPCLPTGACSTVGTCQDGACEPLDDGCDDGDPCTDDACVPGTGCTYTDNAAPCDDGEPCTVGDRCVDGTCAPGVFLCECQLDQDCGADVPLCSVGRCQDYRCVTEPAPNGTTCGAATACGGPGECSDGHCVRSLAEGCAGSASGRFLLRGLHAEGVVGQASSASFRLTLRLGPVDLPTPATSEHYRLDHVRVAP